MPNNGLTAIVAATLNNGIGLNGGLPWRLPNEMKYFARVTTGEQPDEKRNTVLMGRKTWESIPKKFRPLKDRYNVVISRQGVQLNDEPLTSTSTSLEAAIDSIDTTTHRSFLIGGAQLYNLALQSSPPLVDRVLLTRVTTDFECDTFLHDFSKEATWRQASHKELSEWIGWDVPEGEIEEKGVKYRYEMWVKK